jgi:hypothetical protein
MKERSERTKEAIILASNPEPPPKKPKVLLANEVVTALTDEQ